MLSGTGVGFVVVSRRTEVLGGARGRYVEINKSREEVLLRQQPTEIKGRTTTKRYFGITVPTYVGITTYMRIKSKIKLDVSRGILYFSISSCVQSL